MYTSLCMYTGYTNVVEDQLKILDKLLNSVVIADTRGDIVFVNSAFLNLFKYTNEEIIGKSISVIIPEKYREAHRKGMSRYNSTGDKRVMDAPKVKLEGLKSDGEVFPISLRLSEVELDGEKHFFSSMEDLTELTKQEEITKEERDKVDNIARFPEENPSLVFRLSKEKKVLYSNHPVTELWQSIKTFSERKRVLKYLHDKIDYLCDTRKSFAEEYRIGDRIFYVSFVPVLTRYYLNVYCSDITEYSNKIKSQSNQMVKLNKELIKFSLDLDKKVKQQIGDILDSIDYSKNIQQTILKNSLSKIDDFIDNFVIYKPKDVVSGDFYWSYKTWSGEMFIAVGDCTGHGVPGAFLTMLANSLLNEIVITKRYRDVDKILNQLREDIISLLSHRENGGVKDGLDITLIKISRTKNKIEYSGANNPLYHYRGGEIEMLSTDPFSIGYETEIINKFSKHSLKLKKGDRLFLTSDGYQDQFGGEKDKKLKRGAFRRLLKDTSSQSIEEQKQVLEEFLIDWMGVNEQVDDIVLMSLDF
jgi:PAS domain S-box-containing protein